MEKDTILEQSMKEIQEQNFKRSMAEHQMVGDQMNWRPRVQDSRRKAQVLRGHTKMLMLVARGLK